MATGNYRGAGRGGDNEFVEPVTALWRRKWIIIPIVVLFTVGAGLVTPLLPKSYTAEAVLIFPQQTDTGGLMKAFGALSGAVSTLTGLTGNVALSQDTATLILESRTVAYQIIDECKLIRHYHSENKQAAAGKLGRNTAIRHTRQGSVEIEVTDRDPRMTKEITNAYVNALKRFAAQDVNLFLERRRAIYLKDALAKTTDELARSEDALAAFSAEHKIVSIDTEAEVLVRTLGEIEKQLGLETAEAEYATAMLGAMQSALARIAAGSPTAPPAHSPYLQKLRADLVELNYELAMALRDRTEEDPWVRRLQASIDETLAQARTELGRIGQSAKDETAPEVMDLAAVEMGCRAKVDALRAARDEMLRAMGGIPETALEYSRLQRDVMVREKVFETLSVEYEKARVGQMVEEEPFVVLDWGEVPARHTRPRISVNVAIAFVISMVVGILAALAVEGRSIRRD
jgi:uncharacterized protein involved in exopolysaccharide biosynthesis